MQQVKLDLDKLLGYRIENLKTGETGQLGAKIGDKGVALGLKEGAKPV